MTKKGKRQVQIMLNIEEYKMVKGLAKTEERAIGRQVKFLALKKAQEILNQKDD